MRKHLTLFDAEEKLNETETISRIHQHCGKLASHQVWRHFEKHQPSDLESQTFAL